MQTCKTVFGKIKEGDFLSEIQYYKVVKVSGNKIKVRNQRGLEFGIDKPIVEEGLYSANQHDEVVRVTRTELVQILAGAGDSVFTVNFNKKVDPKKLRDIVNSPDVVVKTIKDAEKILLGEERTMVGHLISNDSIAGRFQVQDLEDESTYPKQVDQRTINWVILRNTRYEVK